MVNDEDNRWSDDDLGSDTNEKMFSDKRRKNRIIDQNKDNIQTSDQNKEKSQKSQMSQMNQILQTRKNIPQIIIEERKEQNIKHGSDEKIETKSSIIKSSSGNTEQKFVNKTAYLQKPKKEEKEEPISKSDIQDVKHLLKDILYWLKESEGFKKYPYDEKSREATERGLTNIYKYRNYYDITNTIKIAGPENPNDFDSPVYNKERIFEDLERYSDIVNVSNDGTDTLFAIISHGGRTNFSQEAPIFPGEVKTYYNAYELRFRSPTKGLQYRVTEYDIMDVSESPLIPAELAVLQDEPLPDADTNWLTLDLTPLRTPTTFRIDVAISITGIFSAQVKREGVATIVNFNNGMVLTPGALNHFHILVHSTDTVNFQYSTTGGTIQFFRVQEIDSATA